MVLLVSSAIAFSSSSVKVTYWSFANSYPLTIWSRVTISSSFWQMYCCRRREPHLAWSMLKETAAAVSLAE